MLIPKLIMFDIFNTVFSFDSVSRESIRDYANHIHKPEWSPLILPESWKGLPARRGAREGIAALRNIAMVVTCSNGPLATQAHLARNNNIHWDAIMPLELWQVYKPNVLAYKYVHQYLGFRAEETMMVTRNKDFGDLEGAKANGIQPCLISDDRLDIEGVLCVASIQDLAEYLSNLQLSS